jgi:CHASE3 domain sensor protein
MSVRIVGQGDITAVNDPACRPMNGTTMRTFVPRWITRTRAGLAGPILCAFAVVLVAVTGMFAMQLRGMRSQYESGDAARHAEQVLKTSNTLERRAIDLETGLRGYLLTGDESFLRPYDDAARAIPVLERELRRLSGVPEQVVRIEHIGSVLDVYRRGFAEPLRGSGPALSSSDIEASMRRGKVQMDALREQFAAFNAAEDALDQRVRHRVEGAAQQRDLAAAGAQQQ